MAAATLLPLASAGELVAQAPARPSYYAAIADDRYPVARLWAAGMERHNQKVLFTRRGDVTPVWYDDLYHRWREGPTLLAGLTAHGPVFCLDQLAKAHGMRLLVCEPVASNEDAVQAVVNRVLGFSAVEGTFHEQTLDEDTLYAWVIAPTSFATKQGGLS